MYQENNELYEFGPFRLDCAERRLSRVDGTAAGPLPGKAFETLCVLVRESGHLISKKDLIDQIWPDSYVEENSVDKCIHAIRQALGDSATDHKYIETVRKHGYRFVAPVTRVSSRVGAEPNAPEPYGGVKQLSAIDRRGKFIGFGILTTVLIISMFYFGADRESPAIKTRSIAVLPMHPLDPASRNRFQEAGISDALTLRLSAIRGLVVRPMTAMRKYAESDPDLAVVGREQSVDDVLGLSYQVAGDRIQVTVRLFDVTTGQIAETFRVDKALADPFAMQDAIAREISERLIARRQLTAGMAVTTRGTINEDAYRFYLNGVNLLGRSSLPVVQESIENLEESIRLDAQFARAHAALARGRVELSILVEDASQDCSRANIAAARALELDPRLASAHEAAGLVKFRCEWNFAAAEDEFERAIQLGPDSDTAHAAYAAYLNSVGRSDRALAEIERALALNPNSAGHHIQDGIILFFAQRNADSIVAFKRAGELAPLGLAHGWLWTACIANGDEAAAFEWLLKYEIEKSRVNPDPARIEKLRALYASKGWNGIREMQLETEADSPVYTKGRFFRLARASVQLGRTDEAFDYLERAFQRRDAQLLLIRYEPIFEPLRSDPRFADLVSRIGFPGDS